MKRYKDFMRKTAFSCLTVMLLAACGGKGDDGNVLFEQGLDEMIAGNIPVAYQKFHRAMVALGAGRQRGAEVLRHIAVIQERHKYDLALMEAQKEHQERDILLLGLALCIAALCVIVFLLYKQSKLKLRTETAERCRLDKDIEYKRFENELLTLKMEQMKDELTRQRNDNENVLKQVAVSDGRKDARTRIDMLKATLNTEHAPFLRYIEKRFPQLTHNDVLILGFIRMDMTSREAASALGISVESYYKACYRLRKKMQIDAVDGLVNFVKNVETGQA